MKLTGKIGGCEVTLNKSDIVLQDGKWYEFLEYRFRRGGEAYFVELGSFIMFALKDQPDKPYWIMSEIPTPTKAQLDAIGKVAGDRPVEVTHENIRTNVFWVSRIDVANIGQFRFVLEDAPGEKEKCSCENCGKEKCGESLISQNVQDIDDSLLCDVWTPKLTTPPATHGKTITVMRNGRPATEEELQAAVDGRPLPPVPQDKGEVRTSCEGCADFLPRYPTAEVCRTCYDLNHRERKNYAPAPPDKGTHTSCEGCSTLDCGICIQLNGDRKNYTTAHICTGCTTPAILCPSANDPKLRVKELAGDLKNLTRLLSEYVSVTPCTCRPGTNCWRCVFQYSLDNPIYVPDKPPAPHPLVGVRNEKEFCRDCGNRLSCDDFITGSRIHACCDFGFVKEQPAPAFTADKTERIRNWIKKTIYSCDELSDLCDKLKDGINAATRKAVQDESPV